MTFNSRPLLALQAVVLAVAALYFGQPVFMPLVMAGLLTFLLRPTVVWLEHRRIGRVPSVIMVVVAVLLLLGGVGLIVTRQFYDLALHLDDYRGHVRSKIEWLKQSRTDAVENVKQVITEVSEAIEGDDTAGKSASEQPVPPNAPEELDGPPTDTESPPTTAAEAMRPNHDSSAATGAPADARPQPQQVVIVPAAPTPAAALQVALGTLAAPGATAAVVIVLVVFMLLDFEDLRNRVIRLAGQSRLTLTTRTMDDISRRISRYLLTNALVNGGFGLMVFAGLWAMGVHYSALWGFLAAALRFLPYVGPITAAVLPLAMSIIQFPEWKHPLLVAGWFVVLELITNNIIEPLAYGRSAGVSTVALLVSALFWTWLWGPMGLLLSVPLTVVLAVLGKNIPQFQPLGILLGDEPALAPHLIFYQRLLAGDVEEATALMEEQLAAGDYAATYDRLLIPALASADHDRQQGKLEAQDQQFVVETARELIEVNSASQSDGEERDSSDSEADRVVVVACPIAAADELALAMLEQAHCGSYRMIVAPAALMASEKLAVVAEHLPQAVLISALGSGGSAHVRYLCKRLRQEQPRTRIIVARWGFPGDRERLTSTLKSRGADQVVTTLAEACDVLERIQPLEAAAR